MNHKSSLDILVTQSSPNQKNLTSCLQAQGHRAHHLPCTIIKPKNISSFSIQTTHHADTWIFMSAHAVRLSQNILDEYFNGQTLIAIGPATARALEEVNKSADWVPSIFTSEGIAQLDYFLNCEPKSIVLFSSSQSASTLPNKLKKLGHRVKKITTHSPQILAIPDARNLITQYPKHFHLITSHSLTNLEHLTFIAQQLQLTWVFTCPLLVISKPMHIHAQRLGFTGEILISPDASSDSIFDSFCQWLNSKDTIA